MNMCTVHNCDKPRYQRHTMCGAHYMRWYRHGSLVKRVARPESRTFSRMTPEQRRTVGRLGGLSKARRAESRAWTQWLLAELRVALSESI